MAYVVLFLAANLVVGALACFFGRRAFYLALGALVFVLAFELGLNASDGSPAAPVVALVAGVAAGALARRFLRAGVFLGGAVVGLLLGVTLAFSPLVGAGLLDGGSDKGPLVLVVLVVCVVGIGALAVALSDLAIRAGTALAGAALIVRAVLATLFSTHALLDAAVAGDPLASLDAMRCVASLPVAAVPQWLVALAVLALAAVGFVAQGRSGRGGRKGRTGA